ncbi:MAG: hypothetical protein HQM09_02855 [Candidatus Riflebacteria bacterium]|nr:hypothetical protein [Candidatus Riflebacteria bacterium]
MKTINLKVIKKVLRGILDGTLVIQAVPTGKAARALASDNAGVGRKNKSSSKKPGRKPMSATARRQALIRLRAAKLRQEKNKLPAVRDLFSYLSGKYEGMKLTALASHFHVKRTLLKVLVQKLVKKGDLADDRGSIYLKRRIRGVNSVKVEKAPPIPEKDVLKYLVSHPQSTLAQMAKDLKEKSYQRLIRVMNRLQKNRKVKKDGKTYSMA